MSSTPGALAAALLALALACGAPALAKDKKPSISETAETPYLARDFIFVDSQGLEAYLRTVAKRLLDARGVKMDAPNILIESSDAFDVFTDSRRNLVVSTGALRAIGSEDELAAVLGHELSHLVLKHPQDKDALNALPLGLDTIAAFKTTAAQLKGKRASYSGELSKFGEESLSTTQVASVLWADFLAPSWNRKQERAADQNGFEMMRAAGYDPSAFGVLFQKLHAEDTKRTARMAALKKALLARFKQSQAKQAAKKGSTGKAPSASTQLVSEAKERATTGAMDKVIDELSVFNRQYESPDERQAALAEYARAHRQKTRVAAPAMRWKETVRTGAGANLLALDSAAVATLDALASNNTTGASKSVQALGPGSVKQPSAHLNLAVGSYFQARGRREIGQASARAWLQGKRAPAQAFTWMAYYQSLNKDFTGAVATLENGRKKVGTSAPFLPNLVTVAKAAGQRAQAEGYVRECAAEDRKSVGAMLGSMFKDKGAPSGLYAECVRRLGYEPKNADSAVMHAVKNPVQASKDVGKKIKGLFKKDR